MKTNRSLCISPGGRKCPCCFPPPGKKRKALYRRAKRLEKKEALKDASLDDSLGDSVRHAARIRHLG